MRPNSDTGGVVLTGKAPHSKCGVRRALGGSSPSASAPDPPSLLGAARGNIHLLGAWLSPVERCVRVAEVPGSNPGAPITRKRRPRAPAFGCRTGGRVA